MASSERLPATEEQIKTLWNNLGRIAVPTNTLLKVHRYYRSEVPLASVDDKILRHFPAKWRRDRLCFVEASLFYTLQAPRSKVALAHLNFELNTALGDARRYDERTCMHYLLLRPKDPNEALVIRRSPCDTYYRTDERDMPPAEERQEVQALIRLSQELMRRP